MNNTIKLTWGCLGLAHWDDPEGWYREGGCSGWGTCVYLWQIHVDVWQNQYNAAATAAKSLQSCPTLCDPVDGSSPGSPIPGILKARTLEWVPIQYCKVINFQLK